jgi:hypothetical protein
MATQVKIRRGSTNEIDLFTPAVAELVVDTDKYVLRLGDGVTQGGLPLVEGNGTAAALDVTTSSTDTTAGRITKVGDFGIGTTDLADTSVDVDTLAISGSRYFVNGSVNLPAGKSFGFLVVVANNANNNQIQHFYPQGSNEMYVRASSVGNWLPWVEILTTGNTNFNVFGGIDTNRFIAGGVAFSADICRFTLPSNNLSISASSITVVSEFNIIKASDNITVASGVTPYLNGGDSSNRLTTIQVDAAGAFVSGETYYLRQSATHSKITVNF